MAVKINKDTKPGELYYKEGQGLWQLESYFAGPSATMKNLKSGLKKGGAIGSDNLLSFIRLENFDKEELISMIYELSATIKESQDRVESLKAELESFKEAASYLC